jgi:hypothetical protein
MCTGLNWHRIWSDGASGGHVVNIEEEILFIIHDYLSSERVLFCEFRSPHTRPFKPIYSK